MNGHATVRRLAAAGVIALVGLFQIALIVAMVSAPSEAGPCSVELFGVFIPADPTACYRPIGGPTVLAVASIAVGGALALVPRLLVPAALLCAAAALVVVPAVLAEGGPFGPLSVVLGLLAAVPFLVVAPTGPAASGQARQAWLRVLAVAAALTFADTVLSGVVGGGAGPQLGFAVAGAAVALAGWLSGRLRAAGGIAIPAGAAGGTLG